MRHGRAKAARKTLQFFARTHGFVPPYHVLLDGTFVVTLLRFKIPIRDRLLSVLQGEEFHLYVTRSTLSELHKLRQAQQLAGNNEKSQLLEEAYVWASSNATVLEKEEKIEAKKGSDPPSDSKRGKKEVKDASVGESKASVNDDHHDEPDRVGDDVSAPGRSLAALSAAGREMFRIVTAAAALSDHHATRSQGGTHDKNHPSDSTVHVTRRYVFASQDEALLDAVRMAGCVPIIRLAHNSVLLLENPSRSAKGMAVQSERHKWSAHSAVSEPEKELVRLVREAKRKQSSSSVKREGVLSNSQTAGKPDPYRQRKVKKVKGPNPLSCRKKETTQVHAKEDAKRRKPDSSIDDPERPAAKRRRRRK